MQTRLSSLIEAVISTAIGFVVSVLLTALVLPAYGHDVSFSHNLQITGIFTVASIARQYVVRRWFNDRIHAAALRLAAEANHFN
jgi:heme/copper-type cytochrome/quinol oxidase subunit 4